MINKPLTTEIVDGEIRISIGVDTLKHCAMSSPDPRLTFYNEKTDSHHCYDVTDMFEFAKDVLNEINDEEEDGTTPLHVLIDNAIFRAIENGSLGIAEETKKSEFY